MDEYKPPEPPAAGTDAPFDMRLHGLLCPQLRLERELYSLESADAQTPAGRRHIAAVAFRIRSLCIQIDGMRMRRDL